MEVKVFGVNVWASPKGEVQLAPHVPVFLHSRLEKECRPTPFNTKTIEGYGIQSRLKTDSIVENRIVDGKVNLQEGDYIMMLPKRDIDEYGDMACGHLHYYDGEKLVSVYTGNEFETSDMYDKRKEAERFKALQDAYPNPQKTFTKEQIK